MEKTGGEQASGSVAPAIVTVGVVERAGSPVLVAGLDQRAQPNRCDVPDSGAAAMPSSVETEVRDVE